MAEAKSDTDEYLEGVVGKAADFKAGEYAPSFLYLSSWLCRTPQSVALCPIYENSQDEGMRPWRRKSPRCPRG
jgi:hypothetical protein